MLSRKAFLIASLAFITLPLEYTYAACQNGVCSLGSKAPKKVQVRRIAGRQRNNKRRIPRVAAIRNCKNGVCKRK